MGAMYVPAEKTTLDASYFEDTDGKRYLIYCHEWIQNGNGTIEYIELKTDMKGAVGEGVVMTRAHDATWNTSPVTDGPYLFRTQSGRLGMIWTSWHGGRYVQGVAYSTSGKLTGPWVHEPLPITPDNYGHGMLFRTFEGQLLMSIHSHRTIDESRQIWERHPTLFLMDDSGDCLRTVMEYKPGISASNPVQVMVDNPEFEYGKQGWTCTTGAQNQLIATNQGGAITGNFFESWDANSYTGEIYQEKHVPNGTYQLTAAAFRSYPSNGGSSTAETVFLFANEEKTLVTSPSPQFYTVTVHVTDGRLRFGLRSERKNYQWMGIDNVTINYYGETKLTAEEIDKAERNVSVYLRNLRDGKYLNAGQSWGTQAILADNPLDLQLVPLPNGKYALDTRISNGNFNHFAGANGYLDGSVTPFTINYLDDRTITLTTDGTHYWGSTGGTVVSTSLSSASAKGAQWEMLTHDDLIRTLSEATPIQPIDATFLILCPDFGRNDTRISAWQGSGFITGGNADNHIAEGYNTAFDAYQELTDIPNGIYELKALGFYRNGGDGPAKAASLRSSGQEVLNALLYANDASLPLPSIFEGADRNGTVGASSTLGRVPDSMSDASSYLSAGAYTPQSLRFVVNNNTLKFGVRKEAQVDSDWTVFDNFRLSYLGQSTVGDVNCDHAITIADVTALVNVVLGKSDHNQYDPTAADVNQDNSISIADVTALVHIVLQQ